MTEPVMPTALEKTNNRELKITWNNDSVQVIPFRKLRDGCQCATCAEKRKAAKADANALPILSPADLIPLDIVSMKPAGNYAYNIEFSDGHSTGLFTFDLLRSL